MRTNYVLIDFENVQPRNVGLLNGGRFKVKVFVGANQAKVPLELANAMQALGKDAEYVQIHGNGSNALDFHIAYYIGRLAAETPDAYFHIVSKDTGFDPLIAHLKEKGVLSQRSASILDIPLVKLANAASPTEKVDAIIDNLHKRGASRPRKLSTLKNTVKSIFVEKPSDVELDELIEQLKARGAVRVDGGAVHYDFPG